MSRFATSRLTGLLLALSLVLGGCAGGGDDSEGGVSYSGSTDRATVTGANATMLGASALGSRDTELLLIAPASVAATRNSPSALIVTRSLAAVHQSIRTQPALRGGIAAAAALENCTGGGTISIDRDGDSASVGYHECGISALMVDGEATLSGDPGALVLTFTRLRLSGAGLDLELGGAMTVQALDAAGVRVSLNAVVKDHRTGTGARFDQVVVSTRDNPDGSQTVQMSGRLFHSTEGYVDFATAAALHYVDDSTAFPSAGALRITAALDATILVSAHPGMVEVALDLDADGDYESVVALDWFTFEAGIDLG